LLSLLAAFALSAIASSTALAAHEFIVNGTTIKAGEKVEAQADQLPGIDQFESTLLSSNIHISCQQGINGKESVFLEEKGKAKSTIEFKACTLTIGNASGVENVPACKVSVAAAVTTDELTNSGELLIKPAEGTVFTKITIEKVNKEASCALATTVEVKGEQVCTLPHFGIVVYVSEIDCTPSNSKLKLAAETAKLSATIGLAGLKGQELAST
jgi:hypothetical protein